MAVKQHSSDRLTADGLLDAAARAGVETHVDELRSLGHRIARIVSNVFSPPMLTIPVLVIAGVAADTPRAWGLVLLYAVVTVLLPIVDLFWQLHTGKVTDMHLPLRSERFRSFVVGTIAASAGLALLVALSAPTVIVALAIVVVVQTLLLFGITLLWQVSVHGAAVAMLAAVGTMLMGPMASTLVVLVPVVAWARLRLDRHTPAQIVVGVAIGALVPIVVLGGLLRQV